MTDVFDTLQIYLGSLYVNDFNQFGRTYSVRVQADAQVPRPRRRRRPAQGALGKRRDGAARRRCCKVKPSAGPERAMRYNGFLAADINGGPAPGFSSGQAQAAVERIAAETLPHGFDFEWTDLTYQEILAGNSALVVFPLAILLVFLVLAALYESLTLPLSIIMIVPMGLLAAMTGVWLTGGDNNIFTQIGLDRAGRPVGEERDPDRRVRARARIRRTHAGAGRDRGEPAAAAADPDDLARLHHGRGAAGDSPPAPAPRCATPWASRCSPA